MANKKEKINKNYKTDLTEDLKGLMFTADSWNVAKLWLTVDIFSLRSPEKVFTINFFSTNDWNTSIFTPKSLIFWLFYDEQLAPLRPC